MKLFVHQAIQASLAQLYPESPPVAAVTPSVERPEPRFGDFATNAALQVAKLVGQPPRQVAEALAAALAEFEEFDDVSVAGPGFINLRLSAKMLSDALETPLDLNQTDAGKTVVAEYSDPNPFKAMHAGHLYTTIVGDVIARLHEVAGAKVHRLNFGGDVGLHVGKAMWAILKQLDGEHPDKLAAIPAAERATWVSQRYVAGSQAYAEDPAAKAEIIDVNQRVYQLHANADHDSAFARVYWTCRQWSYDGFEALYKQLGIQAFERYLPESETTPAGIAMARDSLEAGVLEESDGAVVFKGEAVGLHTRVFINSNGLPTYEAKDLGLAAIKWRDYQFDKNIIITGNDIIEYMKVVLAVLGRSVPEAAERTHHLTHGMIRLPGGVKMSSRQGNGLLAQDVLDVASAAGTAFSGEHNQAVVLGAIKYSFLRQRTGGDIIFDPAESVSLEGNSGPYLQYAHARARSILAKTTNSPDHWIADYDEAERRLAVKITEYPEVLARSVDELMPHHICTYLYELTQVFNRFYESSRVIGDQREAVRLALVRHYADRLQAGLGVLGIPAPDSL